ncbi:MAG: class I SAM-dependent methyltransferase [bacterium]|nr:class I SAM-dependent methyltransferase [bacterium]
MGGERTKERQYEVLLRYARQHGLTSLGLMTNQAWLDDPKRLAFTFARYKFVAKMFAGRGNVLEVGCGDAFATRIVVQEVGSLTATDFDPLFISDVKDRMGDTWRFAAESHDMLDKPFPGSFDAAYALDVFEHIEPADENRFLGNIVDSLAPHGAVIIGMPSLESQAYASEISKQGHVNCKTMPELRETMERFFHNVFTFSMNDEVVHTGYHKMAHYLFALGCERREEPR